SGKKDSYEEFESKRPHFNNQLITDSSSSSLYLDTMNFYSIIFPK
ncbi:5955_t:CDS:1, partial [Gigaspora margarita]